MKKKIVLLALSSLSTVGTATALVVGSNSNQNIYAGQNDSAQLRTVVFNSNTLEIIGAWDYHNDSAYFNKQYALTPLSRSGSYVGLFDYSYRQRTWGNGHLYYNTIPNSGTGYGYDLNLVRAPSEAIYYDQALTQQINTPILSDLRSVEITYGEGSIYIPTADYYPNYNYSKVGNVVTISGNFNDNNIDLFQSPNGGTSAEDCGKAIIIDQVKITYYC